MNRNFLGFGLGALAAGIACGDLAQALPPAVEHFKPGVKAEVALSIIPLWTLDGSEVDWKSAKFITVKAPRKPEEPDTTVNVKTYVNEKEVASARHHGIRRAQEAPRFPRDADERPARRPMEPL